MHEMAYTRFSFGTHVYNTSNNTSTQLQLQRIKLHIDIVNLKPVTPTTILLLLNQPLIKFPDSDRIARGWPAGAMQRLSNQKNNYRHNCRTQADDGRSRSLFREVYARTYFAAR